MNPSWRIDQLAHRVLSAAKWPREVEDAALQMESSPTPYFDELEKCLGIYLPPIKFAPIEPDVIANQTTDNPNSTIAHDKKSNSLCFDIDSLEELTPFSPEFFRCMGDLAREAYHSGSVKNFQNESIEDTSNSSTLSSSLHTDLRTLEMFSLPRMHDAVRITRIFLALQQLNVGVSKNEKNASFLELMLYYCEGNNTQNVDQGNVSVSHESEESISTNSGKGNKIPIISALFHHWGNLPLLEHGLQQLSRKYTSLLPSNAREFWEFNSTLVGITNNSSIFDDREITRSELSSSLGSSFLGIRASRVDSFRMRLEQEFEDHISGGSNDGKLNRNQPEQGGLSTLLSLLYRASDASLRGKIRKQIGQHLRSHALSGGSSVSYSLNDIRGSNGPDVWGLGPSFASFCPWISASAFGSTSVGSGKASSHHPPSLTHLGEVGSSAGGMQHNPLGMENTSACGIEVLLQVLLCIIMGFRPNHPSLSSEDKLGEQHSSILKPSHENLLFDVLVPLHRPSGMVLWRDQTPIIGLYHEALVKCIGSLVGMDNTLAGPVIGKLLNPEIWPTEGGVRGGGSHGSSGGAAANTPKVVLLIHEVDTLIGLLRSTNDNEAERCLASFGPHLLPLTIRLCACISSDNSRSSERALQLFRNDMFQRLLKRNLNEIGPYFLRALCRCYGGGTPWVIPWNPTVRKMTLLVLREMETFYKDQCGEDAFDCACDEALSSYTDNQPAEQSTLNLTEKGVANATKAAVTRTHLDGFNTLPASNNMTSLRGAMGSWRPPSQKSKLQSSLQAGMSTRQPPLTITGVAPWAMNPSTTYGNKESSSAAARVVGSSQPPLAITGVAPWAVNKPSQSSRTSRHLQGVPRQHNDTMKVESFIVEEEEDQMADNDDTNLIMSPALRKVRSYMEKLKPPDDDETSSDGISSWAKAQMEESPVLLPQLKFHDLVFGEELGTGAFSTVKYARQIVKDRTRSQWPEFAVKIVSTEKIDELGYEQSVNREIAILRILSHPGISRLISSFRFRDGAYLVLEYASGGDLHTLLCKNGSLDHDSTKFVIGSVAAALWSIHDRGFVYGDCKPENILITETGHIKLTDFGGCRPITRAAEELVQSSSANLIRRLRDGDWKMHGKDAAESHRLAANDDPETMNDSRIEGTTAYLPPEVVIGAFPTTAADIWALGCVMFQCLSGRPPILEDTEESTAQKIVSFEFASQSHDFFGERDGSSAFSNDEKSLIRRMLYRDYTNRPCIPEIATDEYFSGIDIFSLHTKPPHRLDIGSVAPTKDAKWSRRQFSSIWAPQPRAYSISVPSSSSAGVDKLNGEPIVEGDEADVLFFSTQKASMLRRIQE